MSVGGDPVFDEMVDYQDDLDEGVPWRETQWLRRVRANDPRLVTLDLSKAKLIAIRKEGGGYLLCETYYVCMYMYGWMDMYVWMLYVCVCTHVCL